MSQEALNKLLSRYIVGGMVGGALLGVGIGALIGDYGLGIGLGLLFGIIVATSLLAMRSTRR